ncbi:MAG: archaeal heat shock protein Hsp20 [Nitrososphaeraceae archaeon]|jgi:HSP20 family protein|nr:Hsp20/alpha crystallin family protein [Nitrososphaeraceae archaeon]MDW0169792.1 Hsp20/alpha crystallin family protein [Nitrososphaeraceae archaeon]MDW0171244.1 Hsp20/alpha crystallin family protein [Nitrososphaeraceae archaeon]MDW0172752.1 Hsp20/alpha crystallin family protein [Nitrososphaeraceae archaeon]MDW0176254.1 Hsp20/alpha crystallin family protein [Nitrososphaeraceae archaeon]
MSSPFDEWFGRRRSNSWFPDVDSMMKEMEKLMQEAVKNMDQNVPKNLIRERKLDDGSVVREMGPIVYGYSFKIGEDGKPIVRKFGNLNTFPSSLTGRFSVSDQREPVVDIIKDVDKLKIIAELPGVTKGDLRITANETSLTIESLSGERRYNKKIELPNEIEPSSGKSSYKNGILEVTFKLKDSKDQGVSINVE